MSGHFLDKIGAMTQEQTFQVLSSGVLDIAKEVQIVHTKSGHAHIKIEDKARH